MAATDLVNIRASSVNPTHLIVEQKDRARTFHLRIQHPGVAEYVASNGVGNAATGDLGWYINGVRGRESVKLDLGGDARHILQVREAGVKGASWQDVDGWQALVGATRVTGNPGQVRVY